MPDTALHPLHRAAAKFCALVPWMLEAAIVLELVLGKCVEAAIIIGLLAFNGSLGIFPGRACSSHAGSADTAACVKCRSQARQRPADRSRHGYRRASSNSGLASRAVTFNSFLCQHPGLVRPPNIYRCRFMQCGKPGWKNVELCQSRIVKIAHTASPERRRTDKPGRIPRNHTVSLDFQ